MTNAQVFKHCGWFVVCPLNCQANNLKENTQEFKFESNQLRKRMCKKHAKWIAILVGIVVR